jgi:hypothetical protein
MWVIIRLALSALLIWWAAWRGSRVGLCLVLALMAVEAEVEAALFTALRRRVDILDSWRQAHAVAARMRRQP